jgi:hypothetical protein
MTTFISIAVIWFAGDAAVAFYCIVKGKSYTVTKANLALAFCVRLILAGWGYYCLIK